jgi:hypothetical protein
MSLLLGQPQSTKIVSEMAMPGSKFIEQDPKYSRHSIRVVNSNDFAIGEGFRLGVNGQDYFCTNHHIMDAVPHGLLSREGKVIPLTDYKTILDSSENDLDITVIELPKSMWDKLGYPQLEGMARIKGTAQAVIVSPVNNSDSTAFKMAKGDICEHPEEPYFLKHTVSTEKGSSGAPILDITGKKVYGIHRGGYPQYNLGTSIRFVYDRLAASAGLKPTLESWSDQDDGYRFADDFESDDGYEFTQNGKRHKLKFSRKMKYKQFYEMERASEQSEPSQDFRVSPVGAGDLKCTEVLSVPIENVQVESCISMPGRCRSLKKSVRDHWSNYHSSEVIDGKKVTSLPVPVLQPDGLDVVSSDRVPLLQLSEVPSLTSLQKECQSSSSSTIPQGEPKPKSGVSKPKRRTRKRPAGQSQSISLHARLNGSHEPLCRRS